MEIINISLVCDGSSDKCLEQIVYPLIDLHFPHLTCRIVAAGEVIPATEPLARRLVKTWELYQPHIILCHRDAEREQWSMRHAEIVTASEKLSVPTIPIVPVRMLESWLLLDVQAIRAAANNRNGTVALNLPRPREIEGLPDPKEILFDILRRASDLPPQRLRRFREHEARSRVAGFIADVTVMRILPAFAEFEASFCKAMTSVGNQT